MDTTYQYPFIKEQLVLFLLNKSKFSLQNIFQNMKQFALLGILVFTSISVFSQTDYFVATNGNDSNDGSISNPWATIQYGIYELTPGDVLNIRGGIYQEKIDVDVSGTLLQYITIKNYQDEEVILDASNSNDNIPIIYCDDAFIRIEGLWVRNSQINYATGISIQNVAHHIELINNKVSNINFSSNPNATVTSNTNSVPLSILGDHATDSIHNLVIRGNEVFDNRTGFSENITLGGNVSGFIIEDNLVHDNTNIGIDMTGNYGECPTFVLDRARDGVVRNNLIYNCVSTYSSSAGIYVDGGKDILVENNVCHHNGYGGEIGCEENGYTDNVIFRNNLFYLNSSAGMHLGAYDENTTGVVTNSKVLNNTFYHNDTNNWFNGELIISQFVNGEIMNNIFSINAQNVLLYSYRSQPGMVFNYNLIFTEGQQAEIETTVGENRSYQGLSDYYNATGYGANSTFGNPLFQAPTATAPDFHITQNSPAIDAGNPSYVVDSNEIDFDGSSRINNGIIDCGVDEFSNGTISLELKAILQGPYVESNLLMNDHLRPNSIPLQEPYSALGFTHVIGGGETILSSVLTVEGNDAIVDWLFIELRNGNSSTSVVATQSALLQRDGDIVSFDGVSPVTFDFINGISSVFVVIRHRNHLGIRSMNNFQVGSLINIDFTDPSTEIYGVNATILVGNKEAMIAGNANGDQQINTVDKNTHWRFQNAQPYNYIGSTADFNMDGVVNPVDKNTYWRPNNSIIEQLD